MYPTIMHGPTILTVYINIDAGLLCYSRAIRDGRIANRDAVNITTVSDSQGPEISEISQRGRNWTNNRVIVGKPEQRNCNYIK